MRLAEWIILVSYLLIFQGVQGGTPGSRHFGSRDTRLMNQWAKGPGATAL
jgi:hypothetical protein